jgi:hypothetical protein
MDRIKKKASNNSLIIACISVAMTTFSPIRSRATIGNTHIHTDGWEEFMKYAVEMDSVAMIYIPSFIKLIQAFKS